MKILSLALLLLLTGALFAKKGSGNDTLKVESSSKIYQFNLNDLSGEPFQFKQLEGKVVLIVNVASKCGFTNQYEGYKRFIQSIKIRGFVLGIPSNDFGNQKIILQKISNHFVR